MCPFFIVSHVERTIDFYTERLGFKTVYKEPDENPLRGYRYALPPCLPEHPNEVRLCLYVLVAQQTPKSDFPRVAVI